MLNRAPSHTTVPTPPNTALEISERESKKMTTFRFPFGFGVVAAVILFLIFTLYLPVAVHAQSLAQAPAPTSDGTSIDQGIAYVLMMLALALTYLIHSSTF